MKQLAPRPEKGRGDFVCGLGKGCESVTHSSPQSIGSRPTEAHAPVAAPPRGGVPARAPPPKTVSLHACSRYRSLSCSQSLEGASSLETRGASEAPQEGVRSRTSQPPETGLPWQRGSDVYRLRVNKAGTSAPKPRNTPLRFDKSPEVSTVTIVEPDVATSIGATHACHRPVIHDIQAPDRNSGGERRPVRRVGASLSLRLLP